VAGVTEPGVGELPVTGDDVGSLGAAGVVLLTAGAVITARSRRRRSTPPS
jgi:LPXTG-motif cell wall-anchored protein